MGDRKRKGHALNARGDRFITALSDLFEKERMGNLKLVHLSPLYLLLVLEWWLEVATLQHQLLHPREAGGLTRHRSVEGEEERGLTCSLT